MRRIDPILELYEESHKHPTNIKIHWLFEPLAIWAILALIYSVSGLLVLTGFLVVLLTYFARLSVPIALSFVPVIAVFVWIVVLASLHWVVALAIFVVCFVALLGGHRIEGRSPAVFENPQLIIIGPAWLARRVFRRLSIHY